MKYYQMDYIKYIESMREKDYAFIDPPWSYNDKHPKLDNQLDYTLWNNNCKEMIEIFSKIKCKIIYLWTTNIMIEEVFYAKKYFTNWKFKALITWIKSSKKGDAWLMGNNYRNCTEQCLLFTKNIKPLRVQERNIIREPLRKRTEKPRNWEINTIKNLEQRGYTKGCYIFSGPNVSMFDKFDIDCIDIVPQNKSELKKYLSYE